MKSVCSLCTLVLQWCKKKFEDKRKCLKANNLERILRIPSWKGALQLDYGVQMLSQTENIG